MDVYITLKYLSGFSILLPVIVGIVWYNRLSKPLIILSWFLILSAFFEMALQYTSYNGINNLIIINVHNIVEFVFLGAVFYKVFNSAIIKKGMLAVLAAFGAFAVANLLFMQGTGQFNTWTMGLECLLLMLMVLLFLFELFKEGKVLRLERYPMFWVASGALFYFAGSLFLFIFSNYVLAGSQNALYAEWGIHSSVNIITNLCYAVSLWIIPGSLALAY